MADSGAGTFLNGPYLLAPTPTGITVTWETDVPVEAAILYGVSDKPDHKLDVRCERGTPWKDNPEGICMYRAVLTNLMPETIYSYRVELTSGEQQEGTFSTLKENPAEIFLYTVSDSHALATRKELIASVLENRPDFVIHSGDIPLGTGYQKEQFGSLWFSPGADMLKHIPVIYIDGNHDAGPYFADYFMKAQRSVYNASANGLNYAFKYGNTYIVMINSNPWGLDKMNAVMSNLPVDEKTAQAVKDSLEWLDRELKSAAAKQAKWRVVVMHHPYTNHFTNKHTVDILENNKVNLVIAGHLHYYMKSISINPAVGAKTLYITQGSAQDPVAEIDYGKEGERMLPDFPEVIAIGKAVYSTLHITDERIVAKTYGIITGEAKPQLVDESILVQEETKITLSDIMLQADTENAHMLFFMATAKNDGCGLANVVVKVLDNDTESNVNLFGLRGKERVVVLNPGEVKNIRGNIVLKTSGKHVIRIGNIGQTIYVPEPSSVIQLSDMRNRVGEGQDSNVVYTSVAATNTQETQQEANLDFYVNGQVIYVQKINLAPHEKKLINFAYRFAQGGIYQIKVGDLAAKTVEIEGTLKGTPLVKDLSGHGNHGIIRGTPQITVMEDGAVAISLDNYSDYIEIPDNPSLHLQGGFTGMVWANMRHLAKQGEKDHNPIMVKGPSVGWGANYLMRMVVRKIGVMAWGTCYDTTEYAWDGGNAILGEWVQYTSSFDRANGGTAYINARKVADIASISHSAEMRCWEGHPIFVGYAGIGHVIKELNRPKYFTHFPGQISQVRVYAAKLSAEETLYLHERPTESGPREEELRVWLNFKDLETEGQHQTEWRRPAQFNPAYKAEKQLWTFKTLVVDTYIPGAASMSAKIEVSDDQEIVKDAKQVQLVSGNQIIDISDLPKAQFIRIVTRFTSVVGPDGIFIPELNLYKVTAVVANETIQLIWGTRADWEKGSFEGAIGFEPLNRTKVLEEYTDVIH